MKDRITVIRSPLGWIEYNVTAYDPELDIFDIEYYDEFDFLSRTMGFKRLVEEGCTFWYPTTWEDIHEALDNGDLTKLRELLKLKQEGRLTQWMI